MVGNHTPTPSTAKALLATPRHGRGRDGVRTSPENPPDEAGVAAHHGERLKAHARTAEPIRRQTRTVTEQADAHATRIRDALRCGRHGCPCRRPGPVGGTHCPAHEDQHPSLSVSVRRGRVLVHCFVSCSQEHVLAALRARGLWGMRSGPRRARPATGGDTSWSRREPVKSHVASGKTAMKPGNHGARGDGEREPLAPVGLSLARLAEAKRLPVDFLRALGLYDGRYRGRQAVAIPYLDEAGSEVARRFRLALAGDQRFAWQKGVRVIPYGLQRLAEARQAGWVLIVEGESDCWTAWWLGIPALGLPGKAAWRSEWAECLAGLAVYIWQEPGAEDFALRLGRDLPEARVIVAPEGVKDLSAVHVQGHDVPALVERLKGTARPVGELLHAAEDAETRRLKELAAPVLAAPDPLARVAEALRAQGYGGDLTPVIITYLCLTTRLLAMRPGAMPAHLLLVGPPSAGKSYTLQAALRLLPPEAYHVIDAGSPRVLIYDDADLRHRAVVFGEADSLPAGEDNSAASAIRNLLQDHRLHYKVTVRDPDTGQFTVKEVDKPGPTVLMTTAVRPLEGQLGTRVFNLPMPEDVQKVRAALDTQAELELSGAAPPDPALVAFQAYLQRLAPVDVKVPFVRELADRIGRSASATRILRDFARLVALIKAVAVLRHARRERDATGAILATIDDYATVFELVRPMYEATLSGATESVRTVVQAVAALCAAGGGQVTYNAVARRVGLHPEQVKRLVRIAIAHEWLINRTEGRHKPADLDVGEPLPERTGLPEPEELRRAVHGPGAHGVFHLHTVSRDFTVSRADRREWTPTADRAGAPGDHDGGIYSHRSGCETVKHGETLACRGDDRSFAGRDAELDELDDRGRAHDRPAASAKDEADVGGVAEGDRCTVPGCQWVIDEYGPDGAGVCRVHALARRTPLVNAALALGLTPLDDSDR